MKRDTVLIVTDDAAFRRVLERRWQAEPSRPALVAADGAAASLPDKWQVAVVGPLPTERRKRVLSALDSPHRTVLCFVKTQAVRAQLRRQFRSVRFLHLGDDWADIAVVVVGEILGRLAALVRLRDAEHQPSSQGDAAFGSSIREMRHDINNALTSVLGNAELLLLDAATLSAQAREQAETIHSNALHMHQIMRQLSVVEAEVKAERTTREASGSRPKARP